MTKFLLIAFVIGLLSISDSGVAGTGAGVTFMRRSPGIVAEARSYVAPDHETGSPKRREASPGIATAHFRGPVLVPLVGQVSCGHDPRLPGGLTCVVPPPPRVRVSEQRRRPRPPAPDEVARVLADRAISLAPKPELRLTPELRGLTGLPSYFWLAERPEPITARATAGPFVVVAEARPIQYVWSFGDGSDRATTDSGRAWTPHRPGSIDHVYEVSGRYELTVEVVWEARWRLGNGAWRHLGYFTNSDIREYRVRSIVSVLVRAR